MARINVQLVRVTTDDGEKQLWLAATPREDAVDRVLDAIPEGWAASLVECHPSDEVVAAWDMTAGEVRQHRVS